MTSDAAAYIAITRLQAAYADVVTRRAWSELNALFLPDTPIHVDTISRPAVELTGPDELGTFVSSALERFAFFEFVILNTVIDITDDRSAVGRLYIVEERYAPDAGGWSQAFGRYDDTYAFDDGRWRFAARRYRSLARRQPGGTEVLSGNWPDR